MSRTINSPYSKPGGVKLPGLQALRLQDPQAQKAVEALREWVEVRLGSRGDALEKAITLREFNVKLEEVFRVTGVLQDFDGTLGTLRADPVASLPTDVRIGSFVTLENGDLYFGAPVGGWKKVTLT